MSHSMSRLHLGAALIYAMLGLVLGIFMAATHDHGQSVTHAHLLLVGFLMSFSYAVMGRLWLGRRHGVLQQIQFLGHHVGTTGLVGGLFLLYGGSRPLAALEPVLAASSILVLLSVVLISIMLWRVGSEPVRLDSPDIAPGPEPQP